MKKSQCRTIFLGIIVCLGMVLGLSNSASALEFDRNQKSLPINGVDTPNTCTIDTADFGGGNYRGGWRCVSPSSAQTTTFRIKFNTSMPSTYGNLVFVSMAVHNHNSDKTPLAFTGDPYATVLWSEVTGDNTNFTVQGLFYVRGDFSALTLYSDSAMDFNGSIAIGVNTPRAVGLTREPTYDQIEQIKTSLSNINGVSQDIYDKLDDIEDLVQAGLVCNGTIGSGLTVEDHTGSTPSTVQNVGEVFSDNDYYASICQNSLMSYEYIQTNALLNIMKKLDAQQTQALQDEQAVENIENQSASDISQNGNTENAQTQSLISAFSNFVTALGGIQSQGNCRITLPFAAQQGGSQTVDICTVKADAGNDAITIINTLGSITMIVFYIPLVFILLKMIYNEIRSFTNG